MGKKLKSAKISKYLDMPQKYISGKIAEAAGVKEGADSEETIHNLVQKGSDALGLPDSTATNAAKALAVAGLSTFADPVSLIPGAKIAKVAAKAAKTTKTGSKFAEALSKLPKTGQKISKDTSIMKKSDVKGKNLLPAGASDKAAIPLVRAEKVAELGRVTGKKTGDTAAQAIQKNTGARLAKDPETAARIRATIEKDPEFAKKLEKAAKLGAAKRLKNTKGE